MAIEWLIPVRTKLEFVNKKCNIIRPAIKVMEKDKWF
jgi:hypothetical protein